MSISSNVSQHRGNTIVISTGDSNYVWNDKNNDGVVNEGDLIVRTKQSDASVTTWVVGQDEGLHAWGDPHLDNFTLTNDAKQTLTVALQAAFDDAKEDGQLDNQGCLVDIDQALASRGQRDNIVDFHHDIVLKLKDGTRLEIDVAKLGDVAFTENVDIEVLDENGNKLTLTISEVWAGNGGANLSGVRETTDNDELQAVTDEEAADLHVLYERDGAKIQIGIVEYGTDVGTKDYAKVVDHKGDLDSRFGTITLDSFEFYAELMRSEQVLLRQAQWLGVHDDEEPDEEPDNAAKANTTQTGARSV